MGTQVLIIQAALSYKSLTVNRKTRQGSPEENQYAFVSTTLFVYYPVQELVEVLQYTGNRANPFKKNKLYDLYKACKVSLFLTERMVEAIHKESA